MSWSLRISQGDISFDGHQMVTIDGGPKMVQDLACCVLEPMGTDPMHPWFGSIIGGGRQSDGTFNPGVIGMANDAYAGTFVEAEIRRIITQYQSQQATRHDSDVAIYGKSTLTSQEVLIALERLTVEAAQNHMLVTAQLRSGLGDFLMTLTTAGG